MKLVYVFYYIGGGKIIKHFESKGLDVRSIRLPTVNRKYRFATKKEVVIKEAKALIKLLLSLPTLRNAKVYCVSGQYACMLIFKLLGPLMGKEARLYLHNFYLHGLSKNNTVRKVLRFLMSSKRITLIAQTPNEESFFRGLSTKIGIRFVPYCGDMLLEYTERNIIDEGYIFTGGYTNRDYQIMSRLAYMMPNQRFVFVCSKLNEDFIVPSNVKVYKDIPTDQFQNLLMKSAIVVIPLKEDVGSSGQMLCLQAMRCAKPIVYCNVSAISYYFKNGCGYPYKIGDIESLSSAVNDALSNKIENIGKNARQESMNYTKDKELKMVDEVIGIL